MTDDLIEGRSDNKRNQDGDDDNDVTRDGLEYIETLPGHYILELGGSVSLLCLEGGKLNVMRSCKEMGVEIKTV